MTKTKIKKSLILAAMVLSAALLALGQPALAAERVDTDGDGLSDDREVNVYHTDPKKEDTDGDGLSDTEELVRGFSPLRKDKVKLSSLDTDQDGLPDSWEIRLDLDLDNADQNRNGLPDGQELNEGFFPGSKKLQPVDKLIKVNLKKQELAYYVNDIELDKFKISSGVKSMPTPTGVFAILDKVPSKNYGGVGWSYPNTKWNLHFTTKGLRYFIHGAYWHNKFGRPMSHGCVNVSYAAMERLYNFAEVGTRVEIF